MIMCACIYIRYTNISETNKVNTLKYKDIFLKNTEISKQYFKFDQYNFKIFIFYELFVIERKNFIKFCILKFIIHQ
jgi:hypothetical protein